MRSCSVAILKIAGYRLKRDELEEIYEKLVQSTLETLRENYPNLHILSTHKILDGKNSEDYSNTVELSLKGGQKIAKILARIISDQEIFHP